MQTGDLIREFRKNKNIKMGDLSKKLGISVQALSQYELNKREPNLEMLNKIAAALDVEVSNLLGLEEGTAKITPGLLRINSPATPLVSKEGFDSSSGIIEPVYTFFRIVYNHYGLDRLYGKPALEFIYEDEENFKSLLSSFINVALGYSVLNDLKIKNNNNHKITEKFKVPYTTHGENQHTLQRFDVLGGSLGNLDRTKYKLTSTLEYLKSIPGISITPGEIDEIHKVIEGIHKIQR